MKPYFFLLIGILMLSIVSALPDDSNSNIDFDYPSPPNINYINTTLNGSYWTTSTDQSGMSGDKETSGKITMGDLEVYGYNGDSTRSLDWYPTDSSNNYIEVGDALRMGLKGGTTVIEAMDGTNDYLTIRPKGTGSLYLNYLDGGGVTAFFNGGGTKIAEIKKDGSSTFGTSSTTGISQFHGTSYPVLRTSRYTSITNSKASGMSLMTQTSGDMTDGFGGGFTFSIKDDAGVLNEIGGIYGVRDGADNSGSIDIYRYESGSADTIWRFRSNGTLEAQDVYNIHTRGNGSFGAVSIQPTSDSRNIFNIYNSSGDSVLLSVNTEDERVGFGLNNPSYAFHFKPQLSAGNTAPVFFIQSEASGFDSTIGFGDTASPVDFRIGTDNGVGMNYFMISHINNDYALKINKSFDVFTKSNLFVGESSGNIYNRNGTLNTGRINASYYESTDNTNVDMIRGVLNHSADYNTDGTYHSHGIDLTQNISGTLEAGEGETINYYSRGINVNVKDYHSLSGEEGTINYYSSGGYFSNDFEGSDLDMNLVIKGLVGSSLGDLDDSGTSKHYGGYFTAEDTAGYNYGVYGEAKEGQNNYGIYGYSYGDNTNSYGGYFKSQQGEEGTSIGIYTSATGGTLQYGLWVEDGDCAFADDNMEWIFGEGQDASINYDGTNMIFTSNRSGNGIAWFSSNVSATDYIDRTSIYDKTLGDSLDWAKDSNELTLDNTIDHSKFYGYITYEVTDFSRHVINKTTNETYYPYKKIEEGVSMSKEMALLRQQIYDLKTENDMIKLELCNKNIIWMLCSEFFGSDNCELIEPYSWCEK